MSAASQQGPMLVRLLLEDAPKGMDRGTGGAEGGAEAGLMEKAPGFV